MRAAVLSALIAAGLAGSAAAAPIAVPLNHSVRLQLSGPAGSVVVGNAAIADVTVVDSRTLFVQGKSMGSTDVVVVDPLGRTVFSGDVIVSPPARGHVAIYRGGSTGGARSDMACDPRCNASAEASSSTPSAATPAPMSPYAAAAKAMTPTSPSLN